MNETNQKWVRAFPEGDALCLGFPERVTSVNAPEVREEVFALLSLHPHTALVADFAEMAYISSAGLRIIMELVRREKKLTVINVSSEVYEIFDMTGFLQITDIRKKPREISLENAENIAWGANSRVYRLNEDTIVKVYINGASPESIENELLRAKQAFIAGIPTAISYDIVNVEGYTGVVFECVNGDTLRDALRAHPENFDDYMERYIQLLRLFHSTPVTDEAIPDAKELAFKKLATLRESGTITSDEAERMGAILSAVPDSDTYLHGDFHVKNIILNRDEVMLIDMGSLSKGSPLFDLGTLFSTYIAFEKAEPGNNEAFFGLPAALLERMMDRILSGCLPVSDPASVELVRTLGHFQCLYKLATRPAPDAEVLAAAAALFRQQLRKMG